MKKHLAGIKWMFGFILIDSFILNAVKHMSTGMSSLQILTLCNGFAAILFAITLKKKGMKLFSKNIYLHLLRVAIEFIAANMMFVAIYLLPMAQMRATMLLTPVYVGIWAVLILGEKSTKEKWLALLLGLAGVLIVVRPDVSSFSMVSLLPLAASFLFSFGVLILKILSGREHPYQVAFNYTFLTSLVSLPITFAAWQPISPIYWKWILILGILFFAVHITLTNALRRTPLLVIAPFMFLGLVAASFVAFIAFGEIPAVNVIIGGFVIVAVVTYTTYREAKNGR